MLSTKPGAFTLPTIHHSEWASSVEHVAMILNALQAAPKVITLVPRGRGPAAIAAARVSLSRSRARNRKHKQPIRFFTLHHELSPLTLEGERLDAIAVWTSQSPDQKFQELLQGNATNVA